MENQLSSNYRKYSDSFLESFIQMHESFNRPVIGSSEIAQTGMYLASHTQEIQAYLTRSERQKLEILPMNGDEERLLSEIKELYQIVNDLDQEFLSLPPKRTLRFGN